MISLIITVFVVMFSVLSFIVGYSDGDRMAYRDYCTKPRTRFEKYIIPYAVGRNLGCYMHESLKED